MPSIALAKPYYYYPTATPTAPTVTATPGYPVPSYTPQVGTHAEGDCGCGDSHAASPVSGAVAVTVPDAPRFLTSNLRTPDGFSVPLTGEPMLDNLAKLDWKTDWWKYVVGAIAYRLFFD